MYLWTMSHGSNGKVAKDKSLTAALILLLCNVLLHSQ